MQTPLVNHQSATLECPQCGKHAIVSYQSGVYHCLNCDFERNLNAEFAQEPDEGLGKLLVACAGFILTCALLL